MRVLDLGGEPDYWRRAPQQPFSVTVVNLLHFDAPEPNISAVQGSACELPSALASERFDLVVSNSLLEHVGGHSARLQVADVVHAAADRHWVQTPYRYFPIEPHWLFPGFQFLPFPAKVQVTRRWRMGHYWSADASKATDMVHEVELIGLSQMRSYFPSSAVWTVT